MGPAAFNVTPGHVFVTVPQHALLAVDVVDWLARSDRPERSSAPGSRHHAEYRTSHKCILQAWGVDRIAAGAALKDLVARDLAVLAGGRRYANYRLNVPTTTDAAKENATAIESAPDSPGVQADLEAIVQGIRAGHETTCAIENVLGMGYQTVLRRLKKLMDQGIIERAYARTDRRQRYRLTNEGQRPRIQ